MNVEDIPSDVVVEMTDVMHRAFKAGGCRPICHCCHKWLKVGIKFKLATVNTYDRKASVNSGISLMAEGLQVSKEVMLCDECTVEQMNNKNAEQRAAYEAYRAKGGGCHRVNGKIVH